VKGNRFMSSNTQPTVLAWWDDDAGLWQQPDGLTPGLFAHSEPFSGTWPVSGTTRNGTAYVLPTSEPRMDDSGYSSSPNGLLATPTAAIATGGPPQDSKGKRDLRLDLLKTPTAQLAVNGGSQHPDKRKAGGHGPTLADQVEHDLLPTRTARDWKDGACVDADVPTNALLGRTVTRLLPPPRATDGSDGGPNQRGSSGDLMLPLAVTRIAQPAATRSSSTTREGSAPDGAPDGAPTPTSAGPMILLPTPAAHDSGNTPENHLRKKPGRAQVTSLQVLVDYGLLDTGGRLPEE
jgi:hypothetical protein